MYHQFVAGSWCRHTCVDIYSAVEFVSFAYIYSLHQVRGCIALYISCRLLLLHVNGHIDLHCRLGMISEVTIPI
jgi:hypothetical protein